MNDGWDQQTALHKAARFCAYQERSAGEVRKKLLHRVSSADVVEQIIESLIEDDFLNEERFLQAFIKGKFYQKKWGRIKIRYALQTHDISPQRIDTGLKELIPPEDYRSAVRELMRLKIARLGEMDPLAIKGKVFQHLAGKGYEQDVVYEAWEEMGFPV